MRILYLLGAGLVAAGSLVSAGAAAGFPQNGPVERVTAPEDAEFFEVADPPDPGRALFSCHGPKKQESGLRLDSREGLLQGNDAGPVVVPGRPEESPLVEAIRYDAAIKMPPKAKLPAQAIADLTAWVRMGVPWPASPRRPVKAPATEAARRAKQHWAFQPVDEIRRRRRSRTPRGPGLRSIGSSWPGSRPGVFRLRRRPTSGP